MTDEATLKERRSQAWFMVILGFLICGFIGLLALQALPELAGALREDPQRWLDPALWILILCLAFSFACFTCMGAIGLTRLQERELRSLPKGNLIKFGKGPAVVLLFWACATMFFAVLSTVLLILRAEKRALLLETEASGAASPAMEIVASDAPFGLVLSVCGLVYSVYRCARAMRRSRPPRD